jgi:hypothetical protein
MPLPHDKEEYNMMLCQHSSSDAHCTTRSCLLMQCSSESTVMFYRKF